MPGYLTDFGFKNAKTPFADVVPALPADQAELLEASIKENGVDEPITVDPEGNILDGHHRQKHEPDCPFRIKRDLKTEAEKRAYAFCHNVARRQMTKRERDNAKRKMKGVARQLNKERHTQRCIAAMLGIAQSCVSNWLREQEGPSDAHIITRDNRRTSTRELDEKDIRKRLAAGETQAAIARDVGVDRHRINRIAKKLRDSKASKELGAPKKRRVPPGLPLSKRAEAARMEVANGSGAPATAVRYGFTNVVACSAAARVAESGRGEIIKAMDSGFIKIGTAVRLLRSSDEDAQKVIEQAELAAAKKRHKPLSSTGRTRSELLLELLERTWVDWGGFRDHVGANSKIIPGAAKLPDLWRLCRLTRKAVNTFLDEIEAEAKKCSRKTVAKRTS